MEAYYPSSFGCFKLTASDRGLRSMRMMGEKCPAQKTTHPILKKAIRQLDEYFQRRRTRFELPLDFSGAPEFNQAVWQELLQIPYGHTTSYSAIAERLNNPKSVRAVGQANRSNPVAIIVPCHRVVAKNGDLHGYFYGLDMKRKLLELENPMSFAQQGSLF